MEEQDKQPTDLRSDKKDFVIKWVAQTNPGDLISETSSIVSASEDSSIISSLVIDSDELLEDFERLAIDNAPNGASSRVVSTRSFSSDPADASKLIKELLKANNDKIPCASIIVENSQGVHIGNITYITGPIHSINAKNLNVNSQSVKTSPQIQVQKQFSSSSESKASSSVEDEEEDEQHSYTGRNKVTAIPAGYVLTIIDRRTWLAQPPLEPHEEIYGPVPYVIISHTASSSSSTQADSIYLVRHIQCFHIESNKWNDISYNFLVGGDGLVYEGRGWGIVGAHTRTYNRSAVGISFIGCFIKELPPASSLAVCKLLIAEGVRLGYIQSNYKLLGHCQCSPTESPGSRLFEEIKTWPHFSEEP